MDLKQVFGAHMRQLRKAKNLKQDQLAERIEMTIETIGKVERGVVAPSFVTIHKIADALEVSPLALFGLNEDAIPKGERGKLLSRINGTLADMNEDQLARAANMLEAFLGR